MTCFYSNSLGIHFENDEFFLLSYNLLLILIFQIDKTYYIDSFIELKY